MIIVTITIISNHMILILQRKETSVIPEMVI